MTRRFLVCALLCAACKIEGAWIPATKHLKLMGHAIVTCDDDGPRRAVCNADGRMFVCITSSENRCGSEHVACEPRSGTVGKLPEAPAP